MHIFELNDSFNLNQYFLFDNKIGAAGTDRLGQFFIKNILFKFALKTQTHDQHFMCQCTLVDDLLKSIAEKFMHLKRGADNLFGNIRVFESRGHAFTLLSESRIKGLLGFHRYFVTFFNP